MPQGKVNDYYSEIDRMINEGLGGGFIIHPYDIKKLEDPKIHAKSNEPVSKVEKNLLFNPEN